MNGDKPSYLTSTFSLLTILVVAGLVGLCVWTKDINTLKDVAFMLLGGYGVKKGMEIKTGNGNGQPPPAP